eukprot:IDg12802t1
MFSEETDIAQSADGDFLCFPNSHISHKSINSDSSRYVGEGGRATVNPNPSYKKLLCSEQIRTDVHSNRSEGAKESTPGTAVTLRHPHERLLKRLDPQRTISKPRRARGENGKSGSRYERGRGRGCVRGRGRWRGRNHSQSRAYSLGKSHSRGR